MTHNELNKAVARLRTLNRKAAGKESYTYATRVLPIAATYQTPADLVALWIVSLGLYHAAVTRAEEWRGAAALCASIEDCHASLMQGKPQDAVFEEADQYPEDLRNYLRALSQLPRPLVLSGIEAARQGIRPLLNT